MSNTRKSIAVCVTSYNQRDYLIEAVNSVLAQSRMPDQIIVVDDASTDDSVDVLRQYEHDHPGLFTIKVNETNQGIGINRYIGINESRCDLTTYLDGDDLYYSHKLRLEEQCLLDNPDVGFVYSNFDMIDAQSNIIRLWTTRPDKLPIGEIIEPVVAHEFPGRIHCRFLMTNTKAFAEATRQSKRFKLYEDLALYMLLSSTMKCAVIPMVTHGYRQHAGGIHHTNRDLHYILLEEINTYFAHLFDRFSPQDRRRIESKVNRVLSAYAWRAIKDHAKAPTQHSKKRVIELAKIAIRKNPYSVRPKHAFRILATQLRSIE